jgi:hypothetical protein
MVQFSDHHADDYEPYEGYPDGKDLYDAHVEMTMNPSIDEQMSTPEFRLSSLEIWIHNWTPRIQQMEKDIADIKNGLSLEKVYKTEQREFSEAEKQAAWDALVSKTQIKSENKEFSNQPDDFSTQPQIEEELPPDFWEEEVTQLTTVSFTLQNGTVFEMKFPNLEEALKFTEGMS